MFKKLALALGLCLWASSALAQNPTCPTRPVGDNTNACASTAFVQANGGSGGGLIVGTSTITSGTSGGLLYNNGGVLGNLALPGANTIIGNWTASAAAAISNTMPSCADTGSNHLNYVNGTGITCGTTASGINQLTGDVTAGPGTGSVAATVAKINGATLGTTTATSGNLLIGSGSQWATQAVSGEGTLTSGGVFALSRTFSPTMTGNWTLTPATGDGLTVNIVGGTPTTLGLNVTSALSGTTVGTQEAANIFTLNDSTVDSTGSMVTLQAEYVATATANLGNGIGVLGVATTGANTNSFYGFGVQGLCQASKTATAPTGGTLGGAGQCAGMNINGQLIAGATGYFTLFGAEVNTTVVAALSGSAPKFKAGITIAHNTNDAVRGAALAADGVTAADAALSISSHSATDVGWGNGILFSDIHGHKAFTSSSVLINAAVFNGTTTAVKSFIDLTAYSCSNSYIDFTNFVADCSGNTQILNTSAFGWIGNFSRISSPGDGVILLADHTVNNGFGRLQLGGTTALFPAISHTGAVINFVLANLGGDASITAGNATLSGNLNTATIQIGTVAPTGNNLIQIGVASATGRFIDVRNVASPICNITTSICEAQYGVDNGGGVYAWCLACSSTIFGTAIGVPVDFWANNIKTLSVLPGTVSVADAQVYVRATAASGSTITGGLRVDGGAGIAGAIYGGAEITTGTTAVSTLPVCNAGRKGAHHFVTDSNAAFTAGIGAIVATGGANNVPVVCDGTNWRIG